MQRAFDLIKQRLEEYRASSEDDYHRLGCEDDFGAMNACGHAIEIVNQVASEYGGGWIPVSSGKLPEIAGYEVLATLENAVGQRRVTIIFTGYGLNPFWHCNHKEFDLSVWKVIAWQPLPEPYKPKFEFECANPASPELIREVHDKLRKIEPYKAENK